MYQVLFGQVPSTSTVLDPNPGEGVRKQENAERVSKVKECIANECKDSTKVAIGGDMNGHIWELDKCENANGKLMKELTCEAGLTIVNCEWEGMKVLTWFLNDKEYTLDLTSIAVVTC